MRLKTTLLAALMAVTLAGSASADTIYADSLLGTGAALSGTTVDTSNAYAGGTAGATWISGASVTQAGTGASVPNGMRAYLPITIVAGQVYKLTATLSNSQTSSYTAWTALGFTKGAPTGYNWFQNSPASAWALFRGNSGGNGAFAGADGTGTDGTANNLTWTAAPGGIQTVTVILDTTAANWKTYTTINGIDSATYTYSVNPAITHVGIGTSADGGSTVSTVTGFSLSIASRADMIAFGPGATIGLVTNNTADISWTVPFGSNTAALSPTFTLSEGAVCDKASGATNDFTSPLAYTVISSDNLITNVYTVSVTVTPPWTYSAWTGDANSGISGASYYTVAVNFAGAATTVNGVAFQASATSGANFSIGGAVDTFTGGTPSITGDSFTLAKTFIHGANPRTVTLTNLIPGATYETSLFSYGFEATGRNQTFVSGSDSRVIAQNFYGSGQGIRIAYTFVADSSGSKVLTITPDNVDLKFHMSALANRQISPNANILSFGPGGTIGLVTASASAISWIVPFGSNKAALSPTFTLSAGAICDKASGATNDFTSPLAYTVISSDNLITNVYTVSVTVTPDESTMLWNLASGGAWDLSTVNWKGQSSGEAMPFINGKHVIFDNAAGGQITIASGMVPASTTVSATSGYYTFSGGPLAGTGSLIKSGNGFLVITPADHTYSGGTVMNSGTLHLQYVQGTSALGTGPITLNGGVFRLDRFTCTNSVIVNGGSLYLDNGFGNSMTGPMANNSPTPLSITTKYTGSLISGVISGSGGITVYAASPNPGFLVLSGNNTYTGTTTVASGTLQCNHVNALGSGALTINAGGAKVNLNYTGTHTVTLLTLGGVVKKDPGTYGSVASGANYQDDTYFAGSGTVRVPPPKGTIISLF
jgi:autotransporter-associated beta strand protein